MRTKIRAVTLCDTGPLVAIVNAADSDHTLCAATLSRLAGSLLTTWPCLTEAMYILGTYGGLSAQEELWRILTADLLMLHHNSDSEWPRMHRLMQNYRDTPMDFADASLVALAENLNVTRIFTLDSHFFAYRIYGATPFQVIP